MVRIYFLLFILKIIYKFILKYKAGNFFKILRLKIRLRIDNRESGKHYIYPCTFVILSDSEESELTQKSWTKPVLILFPRYSLGNLAVLAKIARLSDIGGCKKMGYQQKKKILTLYIQEYYYI